MDRKNVFRAFVCLTFGALLGTGCAPKVGDSCISSAECGPRQFCDTTAPGGYCLRFDCFDDACPGEAICVDFGDLNACMKRCDSDRDCRTRDGYECRDDVGDVPFCYAPVSEDMSVRPTSDAGSSDTGPASDVTVADGSADISSDVTSAPDDASNDVLDGSGSVPSDGSAQAETDGSAGGGAP